MKFLSLLCSLICSINTSDLVLDPFPHNLKQNLQTVIKNVTEIEDIEKETPKGHRYVDPTTMVQLLETVGKEDNSKPIWKMGKTGNEICPTGYYRIPNTALCRQAAEENFLDYKGEIKYGMATRGCFKDGYRLWFATGGGSFDNRHGTACYAYIKPHYEYRFQIGPVNSEDCPDGYSRIMNKTLCKIAAGYEGNTYMGDIQYGMRTRGCFHDSNKLWYATGGGSFDYRHGAYCYLAPVPISVFASWVYKGGGVTSWFKQRGTSWSKTEAETTQIETSLTRALSATASYTMSSGGPGAVFPTASATFSYTMSVQWARSHMQSRTATFGETRKILEGVGCTAPKDYHHLWVFAYTGKTKGETFQTILDPTNCVWTKDKGQVPKCEPGYCNDGGKTGCQGPCSHNRILSGVPVPRT